MPILAVNQFGQIYETSPDREDGGGYGDDIEVVEQGDLTLGAAYLNAQSKRQRELLHQKKVNRMQEAEDEQAAFARALKLKHIQAREAVANKKALDPRYQGAMMRKALSGDCGCGSCASCSPAYNQPLAGNVFTANGQRGWAGMNRSEQNINMAMRGMGNQVAYKADPAEARQAAHREHAERILRLKARR